LKETAACPEVRPDGFYLSGIIGSVDGRVQFKKKIKGSKKEPEETGEKLANDLLQTGARGILDEIYKTTRSTNPVKK
jgi:porphobilinogen deaminase